MDFNEYVAQQQDHQPEPVKRPYKPSQSEFYEWHLFTEQEAQNSLQRIDNAFGQLVESRPAFSAEELSINLVVNRVLYEMALITDTQHYSADSLTERLQKLKAKLGLSPSKAYTPPTLEQVRNRVAAYLGADIRQNTVALLTKIKRLDKVKLLNLLVDILQLG